MPLLLITLLAVPVFSAEQEKPQVIVKKVEIKGNNLIETATIKSRLQTAEDSVFDTEVISEDIRSIYNMGYFRDVQVEVLGFEGGLAVTFLVKEKPLIARIEFKGNKEVKSDKLKSAVGIKTNTVIDEYEINLSVQRLLALLHQKGFYQAEVNYRLEDISENEVGLIYFISEGESLWITKITVLGNEAFTDNAIKKVMKTTEKGLFSFFTHSGTLQKRLLEEDVFRITSFLNNNGHLRSKVDEPEIKIDEKKKEIKVIISIEEGPRYRVGKLTTPGDEHFKPEEIFTVMKIKSGQVFRRDIFAKDITAITGLYTDKGFAFCRVDSETELDDEKKLVHLHLTVETGPMVTVGRINISGNQTTRDNVIRREMVLREGELFSSKDLARSRQKIMNLGFFDKVDITTARSAEDVIDINIDLTERLTGNVTFGVGYSSETKFGGIFKITKDNLFGRGHKLQASVEYASKKRDYNIFFSNPSVWDSPYSFGFKVYDYTQDYNQYDRTSTGGSITVGRSLGEYFRGFVTFKSEASDIFNIGENVSNIIREQEGRNTTRSTRLNLVRDTRDSYFNPTRGSNIQLRGEYAGGFQGGDNYFTKYEAEAIFFLPIWWKLVFSQHGEIGWVEGFSDREVPIYERFFLGGINSVRGFESRSIGPIDENGDPVGGYRKLFFNSELIFPISEEQRLMGVMFFDAGQAFDKGESMDLGSLRTSVGAGVRWFSPIGPFRIEWGYNLKPKPGEVGSDWQFSIGTAY